MDGNVLIESREKEVIGAMSYVAPEVLDGKPYTQVFVMTSFVCSVTPISALLKHNSSISFFRKQILCIWSHNVDV